MTVCMHCKQLTDGLGPLCISCRTDVETLERGINRQCQQCGGYEYDDGTCELCYCDDEELRKERDLFRHNLNKYAPNKKYQEVLDDIAKLREGV